jgi:hypothetical protein
LAETNAAVGAKPFLALTPINRLTASEVPRIVGSAMTTAVLNNFIPTRALADVVIHPRGRRMSWKVAGKYDPTGKQRGQI